MFFQSASRAHLSMRVDQCDDLVLRLLIRMEVWANE